ncbi:MULTISPECIES: hypothetical protein [Aliiglaciecola]|uniref:hypothetical protein n=1 Tax=Aliiglaciecola TaxID=1406885 RepID=UPI001C093395|nr:MULTISPECIES: hypothetical protein [Aliiglaciecola]MBU2878557.1 hypothetical protein [Aliiglaciecola lipolytica]MDO6709615.1 hypothetical protein [Aliiglaciecola sp. 2_MG-2023]MDO6750843.1 hypothetical protein [Aliiglaciecola sp. 1_MG-2023]
MSNLKMSAAALLMISTSGCITEKVSSVTKSPIIESDTQTESLATLTSTQQAVIDGDAAVAQQNFKLLAFTNKVISFPGVDMNLYPLEVLQQQCGIKYLSGSGDTLAIGESTETRKALKNYATTYNLIVLKGCQSFHKNNQK